MWWRILTVARTYDGGMCCGGRNEPTTCMTAVRRMSFDESRMFHGQQPLAKHTPRSFSKVPEAIHEAPVGSPSYHVTSVESPRIIEYTPAMSNGQCSMVPDASSNIQRSRATFCSRQNRIMGDSRTMALGYIGAVNTSSGSVHQIRTQESE